MARHIGIAAVFGVALCAAGAGAQDAPACAITRLAGSPAQVVRDGGAIPAAAGMSLRSGDRLITGAAALMTVTCDGGLAVMVGPATTLDLDTVAPPGTPARAGLVEGAAGFLFNRSDRRGFEVVTPSAVAAVRGTEWAVRVTGSGTAVFVRDGTVAVAAGTGTAMLSAGQGIDVTAGGVSGPVEPWAPARIAALAALLGPDWGGAPAR